MNLTGKTREQIAAALAGEPAERLLSIIADLVHVEQWFKPSEIAERRRMSVEAVRAAMKAGKFGGGYYRRAENVMRVSASGVAAYDRALWVPCSNAKEKRTAHSIPVSSGKVSAQKGGEVSRRFMGATAVILAGVLSGCTGAGRTWRVDSFSDVLLFVCLACWLSARLFAWLSACRMVESRARGRWHKSRRRKQGWRGSDAGRPMAERVTGTGAENLFLKRL